MKKWIKRLAAGAVIYFLTMVLLPLTVSADTENKVLRVAFPEAQGLNEVYEDGTYGGAVYDWLMEISKYTGWSYEFVTGDSSTLMEEMIAGKYDLMGGMYLRSSLQDSLNYPKFTMGSNYSLLIYRRDDTSIKGFDNTTLNGKRIGVFAKATDKVERLKKFLDFNELNCEIVSYEEVTDYEQCLEDPKIDLMLGSDVYMKKEYNVAAKFPGEPYYIVTAKEEDGICRELEEAMDAIYAANPEFAEELYEKYYPEKYINSISFTQEELTFIRESKPIRVAVIKNRYPLFYEQEKEEKGVILTSMDLIGERTGLTFEYVYADNYHEALSMVKEGKADIFNAFMDSDSTAESMDFVRTSGYLSLDSVILRNKKSADTGAGMVMAMPRDHQAECLGENDSIKYYDDYGECLKAVNRGEADYTQMPTVFTEGVFSEDYYTNVVFAADTNMRVELSLAMAKPVNVPLYSVLNKGIHTISPEETAGILAQNTVGLRDRTVSLKRLLYSDPVVVIGVCVGIIILLSIIIILVIFYHMRDKIMKVKLEKAEETSKEKADFLSRMSHEIRTPMNAIIGLTGLTQMSGEVPPAVEQNLEKINSSAKFLLSLLNDVLDMSKIDSKKMQIQTAPFDLNNIISQMKNMFGLQMQSKEIDFVISSEVKDTCFQGDEMRLQQVLTNLLSNAWKFTGAGGKIELLIRQQHVGEEEAKLYFSVTDTGIGIEDEDMDRIFHAFEQAKGSNKSSQGTGLGLAISSSLVRLMGGELKADSQPGKGSSFYFSIHLPVCNGSVSSGNQPAGKSKKSLNGLHVLLAEDNDINAEIAEELLKMQNITVVRAVDGQQAASLFAQSGVGEYDLILMDINMPVMNGLEASRKIRGMSRRDALKVPILAMTANTFQEDREEAACAGMTDFLPKPFDAEQLYEMILHTVNPADDET